MASIHAEVSAGAEIAESHAIVDRIEREAAPENGTFAGNPYGSGRNR